MFAHIFHSSILERKYDVILTSPTCMHETTYYIIVFHNEGPPIIVVVWSANHFQLISESFIFYFSPRFKLFFALEYLLGFETTLRRFSFSLHFVSILTVGTSC